jgi:hypothetical protein
MTDEPEPGSTLRDVRQPESGLRSAVGRRVLTALLLVVVLAGATGLLGVRTTTATTTAGGYTVSVTYAWVARAGLDAPWKVSVHRPGGFPGPVTLSVTADYFDIFESQGLDPEPATETADADRLYWTFDPPPAEDFAVDFDAYIQPASQLGASGEVAVLENGAPVASVAFDTVLVP